MRKLYATFLLAVCLKASSQDLGDSLSKYSYLIQTKKNEVQSQATGFFVRHQQRLFFVTAAHCLTGWDPFSFRRVEDFPDTVFIRMTNDTSRLRFLSLPVAGIKQKTLPFREYESPDVLVVEIRNPKAYKVHTVEKYFGERIKCENVKSIWVSGYPRKEDCTAYLADRQLPSTASGALGEAYCYYPFRPEAKRPDELNYVASLEGSCAGLAGAPAYILTNEKRIAFGGLYIGGADKGLRTGMVVRPEYVLDKIMSEINSR